MTAESSQALASLPAREGHFRLESGHHSDMWMDLEVLCLRPTTIKPLADQLAERLRPYALDVVCGPLNEGAFVALMVASALGCQFTYAERIANPTSSELFPVRYQVPRSLHKFIAGKRIGVVNDVTSAGSAVRGAYEDVQRIGGNVAVVGSLLVLGSGFQEWATGRTLPVESLEDRPHRLWTPTECPLCAANVRLEVSAAAQ